MPRQKNIVQNLYPYHITARVNNRENFPVSLDEVWKILTQEIFVQDLISDFRVHALVLMPNHIHIIASTISIPLSTIMREILSKSSRRINAKTKRTGHLWGSRYYAKVISNQAYLRTVFKYVYLNPVRAGICNLATDYQHSTLCELLAIRKASVRLWPISDSTCSVIPFDYFELIQMFCSDQTKDEVETAKKFLYSKRSQVAEKYGPETDIMVAIRKQMQMSRQSN
jgi:putative transposase